MPNLSRLTCSLFTSQIHILFTRVIISPFVKSAKKQRIINEFRSSRQRSGGQEEDYIKALCQIFFRLFSSQLPPPSPPGSVPPRGVMVTAAAEAWAVTVEAERWRSEQQHGRAEQKRKPRREERETMRWEGRVCRSTAGGFLSQHDVTRTTWLGWGTDCVVCW